jgi:hypothetical protein
MLFHLRRSRDRPPVARGNRWGKGLTKGPTPVQGEGPFDASTKISNQFITYRSLIPVINVLPLAFKFATTKTITLKNEVQ